MKIKLVLLIIIFSLLLIENTSYANEDYMVLLDRNQLTSIEQKQIKIKNSKYSFIPEIGAIILKEIDNTEYSNIIGEQNVLKNAKFKGHVGRLSESKKSKKIEIR